MISSGKNNDCDAIPLDYDGGEVKIIHPILGNAVDVNN